MERLYKQQQNSKWKSIIEENANQEKDEKSFNMIDSFEKNEQYFINYVQAWKTKNFNFLNENYRTISFQLTNVSFPFLFQSNVLFTLNEIVNQNIPKISFHALDAIYRIIIIYPESTSFFFNQQINFQNYMINVIQQFIRGNVCIEVMNLNIELCHYIFMNQDPNIIDLFQQKQFLNLLIQYMNLSFEDPLYNDDGSSRFYINIEKNILDMMNKIIIDRKFNNTNEFQSAIIIYFKLFYVKNRDFLYEITCNLFKYYLSENIQFLSILNDSQTLDKFVELISNKDLFMKSNQLTPIFDIVGSILSYHNNNNQNCKAIIQKLAEKLNKTNIFSYLIEDFESLKNKKHDLMYTKIVHLLINLINVSKSIPNDISPKYFFDVVNEVLNHGRSELKCKIMIFFNTYCQYADQNILTVLLESESFRIMLDSMESYDENICFSFLKLIDCINSKFDRFAFKSKIVKMILNDSVPNFIQHLINEEISDKIENEAAQIMKTYYNNLSN